MRKAKFKSDPPGSFFHQVHGRVKNYFAHTSPYANATMRLKLIVFFLLYVGLYACILSGRFTGGWLISLVILAGTSQALIGLNVAHDAVHDALFASRQLNRLFSYSFELIGMSSYVWKLKHNGIHHTSPRGSQAPHYA